MLKQIRTSQFQLTLKCFIQKIKKKKRNDSENNMNVFVFAEIELIMLV